MKNRMFLFIAATAAVTYLIVTMGCSSPEDPEETASPDIITITDNVNTPTVWKSGKVYLIRVADFWVNNTLTIEPGVIVKFHPTEGAYLTLGGTGTLVAVGNDTMPIVFTSYKDDAYHGDDNGDGTTTVPARKDWARISTNGLNGSRFEYCHFFYGGAGGYSTTLEIPSGSIATVKNCVFAHNDGSDASGWYGACDASGANQGTVIGSCVFYDNIRPLSVSMGFDIDNSNVFHHPADQSITNINNGIFVTDHAQKSALSWSETEVAFVIDDVDLWIKGSLTVADDVVVKFRPDAELIIATGAVINNPAGTNVYFTSYKDDGRKGDTNGDGSATAPGNGDWGGIYDDAASAYMNWSGIVYDSN